MFGFEKPLVFDIAGNAPGKTLVITGGMDGDEYAGIEAAYRIAHIYRTGAFSGRLLVIPIVNRAGFRTMRSENPLDGKFPKNVFPGSRFGSASSRLVAWLERDFVSKADAWLDMHSGASTEALTPFLWCPETGTPEVDALVEKFYSTSHADVVVTAKDAYMPQSHILARRGALYIIAESGERGERKEEDIARHVAWAESLMRTLGMLPATAHEHAHEQRVLHTVEYIRAPYDGIVRPAPLIGPVTNGDVLGSYSRYDGSDMQEIIALQTGILLWRKDAMAMRKGEILWALGVDSPS